MFIPISSYLGGGPWLAARMCVTENAQCSTITCADGWSADSSAEGTKCAGLVCDNTGADNALCCDGATHVLLITLLFGAVSVVCTVLAQAHESLM